MPVLDAALGFLGVDAAIRMHVAVATSLATIIPTSIASSRAHHARQSVDVGLARRWSAFIFAGALFGTWIAARVHSDALSGLFAVVAFVMGIKLLLPTVRLCFARIARQVTIVRVKTVMGITNSTITVLNIGRVR